MSKLKSNYLNIWSKFKNENETTQVNYLKNLFSPNCRAQNKPKDSLHFEIHKYLRLFLIMKLENQSMSKRYKFSRNSNGLISQVEVSITFLFSLAKAFPK